MTHKKNSRTERQECKQREEFFSDTDVKKIVMVGNHSASKNYRMSCSHQENFKHGSSQGRNVEERILSPLTATQQVSQVDIMLQGRRIVVIP